MKLLLTSLGIGAVPGFVEGATGRAPEGLHLGFIWDAAAAEAEDPEGQWQLDRLEALGFKATRILAADATSAANFAQTLSQLDVVYVAGGNSFALLAALRDNGAGPALVEAVRAGLPYIGMSAGSVVAGSDLEPIALLDDPRVAPALENYEGMGMIQQVVVPHADGKLTHYPRSIFERIDREYGSRFPLLYLDDDEALLVSGGSIRVVESL